MSDFEEEYDFMKKIHGVNNLDSLERNRRHVFLSSDYGIDGYGDTFHRDEYNREVGEKRTVGNNNYFLSDELQNNAQKKTKEDIEQTTQNSSKENVMDSIFHNFVTEKKCSPEKFSWNESNENILKEEMQKDDYLMYGTNGSTPFEKEVFNDLKTEGYITHENLVRDKFMKFRKGEFVPVREGSMEPGVQLDRDMQVKNVPQKEFLRQNCEKGIDRFGKGLQKIKNHVNELATCDEVVYYIHANSINMYEYINHHVDLDKYYIQVKEMPRHCLQDYEDEHGRYIRLNENVLFKSRHNSALKGSVSKNVDERKKEEAQDDTRKGTKDENSKGTTNKELDEMKQMEEKVRQHMEATDPMRRQRALIQRLLQRQPLPFNITKDNFVIIPDLEKEGRHLSSLAYYLLCVKGGMQAVWHMLSTIFHYDYLEYPYIKRYATYDYFQSNVKEYMKHFEKKDESVSVSRNFLLRNRYLIPFFIHNTMDVNYNLSENGIVVLSGILPFIHNFESDCKLHQHREKESAIEKELHGEIPFRKDNPVTRFSKRVISFFMNNVLQQYKSEEAAEQVDKNKLESQDCAKFLKRFENSINDEGECIQDILFPGKVQLMFFNFNSRQLDTNHFETVTQLENCADSIKTYKIILGFDKREHVLYSNILVSNVLKSIKKKHPNVPIDDNNPKQHIQYMCYNRWNFFARNDDAYWKRDAEDSDDVEDESETEGTEEDEWDEGYMRLPVGYHRNMSTPYDSHTRSPGFKGPVDLKKNTVGTATAEKERRKRNKKIPLSKIMDYLCYSPDHLLKKTGCVSEYVTCVSFDNSANSSNLINNFALGYNTGKVEYIYGKIDYENMNHCDLLVDYYMDKNKKFTYELNRRFYLDGGVIKILFAPNGFYCLILTYNTLYRGSFFYGSLCDVGASEPHKSSFVNILWLNNNSYAVFCNKGTVHIYEKNTKSTSINGFTMTKSFFLNQPIYLNSVCSYHTYNNCIYLYTGEIEKKRISQKKESSFLRGVFQKWWRLRRKKKRRKLKEKKEKEERQLNELYQRTIEKEKEKEKYWTFEEELRKEVETEEREGKRERTQEKGDETNEINGGEATLKPSICNMDSMEHVNNLFQNENRYETLEKKKKKKKKTKQGKGSRRNYFYKFEGNFLMIDLDGEANKKFVQSMYASSMYGVEKEGSSALLDAQINTGSLSNGDIERFTEDQMGNLNLLLKHVKFLEKYLLLEQNGEDEYDFQLERRMPSSVKELNEYISGAKGMNALLNNVYTKEMDFYKEEKGNERDIDFTKEYDLSCFREQRKFSVYTFLRNYMKEVYNYLYNVRNENIVNILLPRFYSTDMEMNYTNFLNVRYFTLENRGGKHLIALDTKTDYVYIYEIKKNVYIENELLERPHVSGIIRNKLTPLFDSFLVEIKNLKPYWKIFEDFIYINTKTNFRYIKFNLLYVIRNEKKLYFPLHVHVVEPKAPCDIYYLLIKWATISSTYVSSAYNSLSKISKKGHFWSKDADTLLKALEEQKDVYLVDPLMSESDMKEAHERSIGDWLRFADKHNGISLDAMRRAIRADLYAKEKMIPSFRMDETYKENSLGKNVRGEYQQSYNVYPRASEKPSAFSKYKISNLFRSKTPEKSTRPEGYTLDSMHPNFPSWAQDKGGQYGSSTIGDPTKYYPRYISYPQHDEYSNRYYDSSGREDTSRGLSFSEKMKRYLGRGYKDCGTQRDASGYRRVSHDRSNVIAPGVYASERERNRGYYNSMLNDPELEKREYHSMRMGNKGNYFIGGQRNNDWDYADNTAKSVFYNAEDERIFSTPPLPPPVSPKKSKFSTIINALGILKPFAEEKKKRTEDYTTKSDWYTPNMLSGNIMGPNTYGNDTINKQRGMYTSNYYDRNYASDTSGFFSKGIDAKGFQDGISTLGERTGNPMYRDKETSTPIGYATAATSIPYDTESLSSRYDRIRNRRLTENIVGSYPTNYENFRR